MLTLLSDLACSVLAHCEGFVQTTSRYPDFKHKNTREALWVGDLRTPAWVKQHLNATLQDTTSSGDQSPLGGHIENERYSGSQCSRYILASLLKWCCST